VVLWLAHRLGRSNAHSAMSGVSDRLCGECRPVPSRWDRLTCHTASVPVGPPHLKLCYQSMNQILLCRPLDRLTPNMWAFIRPLDRLTSNYVFYQSHQLMSIKPINEYQASSQSLRTIPLSYWHVIEAKSTRRIVSKASVMQV